MIEFVSFESDIEKFMSDILKTIASQGSFCDWKLWNMLISNSKQSS